MNDILDKYLCKLTNLAQANAVIAPLEVKYNLGEITKEEYIKELDRAIKILEDNK